MSNVKYGNEEIRSWPVKSFDIHKKAHYIFLLFFLLQIPTSLWKRVKIKLRHLDPIRHLKPIRVEKINFPYKFNQYYCTTQFDLKESKFDVLRMRSRETFVKWGDYLSGNGGRNFMRSLLKKVGFGKRVIKHEHITLNTVRFMNSLKY